MYSHFKRIWARKSGSIWVRMCSELMQIPPPCESRRGVLSGPITPHLVRLISVLQVLLLNADISGLSLQVFIFYFFLIVINKHHQHYCKFPRGGTIKFLLYSSLSTMWWK